MRVLRRFVRRLRRLLGLHRAEAEMAEEMQYHLEHRAAEYAEDGLAANDAREAACRKFGNVASLQERSREAQRWTGIENVAKDLRFAVRYWLKSPGFTVVAVLTLTIGIGASTAIFSVVNAMVLRPLPYPDAESLKQLWSRNDVIGPYPVANGALYLQWRDHAKTVEVAGINERLPLNVIDHGIAENVNGAAVTTNYLDVLGIRPARGRSFRAGDEVVGQSSHVVILTHEWWQNRFGGDPSILQHPINLHLRSYQVVGILPPKALVHDDVNFLVPLVLEDDGAWRMRVPCMTPVVRLHPGVTETQATQELEALTRELESRDPPDFATVGHQLEPLQLLLVGPSPPPYGLLLGAVGIVLLIVSVNLATLLLARATARQKEIGVRVALGASTGRIMRQMLTECVVLAGAGGALGIVFVGIGVELLGRVVAGDLPEALQPRVDGGILLVTIIITSLTSLLFGMIPALRARSVDVQRSLKDESFGSTASSRFPVLSALIVTEIAMTVMLLIGAGLLGRSFHRLVQVDPGFEADHVLTCDVALTPGGFPDAGAPVRFQRELIEALRQVPGVVAAGTSTTLPLRNERWGTNVRASGASEQDVPVPVGFDYVSGDYFRAMGMTLMRGRWLDEGDQTAGAPRVVVITQSCASVVFPGQEPLGQHLHFENADWEVIGVVGDVRYLELHAPAPPRVYAAHAFNPWVVRLVLRTTVTPLSMVEAVRGALARVDPTHAASNFRTLDAAIDDALGRRRGALCLIGSFAAVALALAALGVYGVIAYNIAQAERELAIRIALGSERGRVFGLLLQRGLRLTVAGIGLGLAGALVASRLVTAHLYEVNPYDPFVFLLAPLIIAGIALLATALPARRATRTDVLAVLRAG